MPGFESALLHTSGPYHSSHGQNVFHGPLTVENFEEVGEHIKRVLHGKPFMFVGVNEGFSGRPEVRTGVAEVQVKTHLPDSVIRHTIHSITVTGDAYFSSIHPGYDTVKEAREARGQEKYNVHNHVWLDITENAVMVEHFAPAGYHMWWEWKAFDNWDFNDEFEIVAKASVDA